MSCHRCGGTALVTLLVFPFGAAPCPEGCRLELERCRVTYHRDGKAKVCLRPKHHKGHHQPHPTRSESTLELEGV